MLDHEQTIASAFTAQAQAYNASPTTNAAEVLDAIVALAAPRPGQAWLDAACGPGIVSRRLAALVDSVIGIDLTPAMVALARAQAADAGIRNTTYTIGDATATGLDADAVDGAVTRYSLHHLPLPGRLVSELARVVRPGGTIVLADHAADEDAGARSWAEEIERLRDPSHWACLPVTRLRALGAPAGLRLVDERCFPFAIDFDEWLTRGTGDPAVHRLVEDALHDRPGGSRSFSVREHPGGRTLTIQMWVGALRV